MGCGISFLYIFYYEKSYLGVHHYVHLGIFVVIGLVFLFQFLTAYELANKEPEDYGYFAVIHCVNVALEKHFKTDAWVIKYYQSFVYVLMFLSSLSSLCEFCPIFFKYHFTSIFKWIPGTFQSEWAEMVSPFKHVCLILGQVIYQGVHESS